MAAKTEVLTQPDYGIDAPHEMKRLFWRGGMTFALGLGLYVMNRVEAPGPGMALFVVLGLIGIALAAGGYVRYWSSKVAKAQYRDKILDALPWRGDEKVLDVGCGRGLMAIGAAKRLAKGGRVIGVDIWSAEDLSGNSGESAMANAKAEGVADKVRVENGDMRRLPYQPNSYDTVVSSLALHNLADSGERDKALAEMWRVLKPGGHLAIFDVSYAGEYMAALEKTGAEIVAQSGTLLLWCTPTRWFVARKGQ